MWDRTWHIVIPSSANKPWPWADAPTEDDAEEIFHTDFPSLCRHLKPREPALRKRTARGKYWWELRACDYYEEYDRPKILVQCIAYFSQFALDSTGDYVNNKVLLIPSDSLYLLAILNSRVTWWIINRTFQHMKDDGVSVDVQFLLSLPIPNATAPLRTEIEALANRLIHLSKSSATNSAEWCDLETHLNSLVQQAFDLTPEEVGVLEHSLPPRDPIAILSDRSSAELTGVVQGDGSE